MGVRTGAVVGQAVGSGISVVWAGQASNGGSGKSVASVAPQRLGVPRMLFALHKLYVPHMLFAPGRLEAPQMPFAPCRLEAPQMLFAPCKLDAVHTLFVPGRLDAVHMLVFLGRLVALGTFVAPQKFFVPHTPSALQRLVSL